MNESYPPNWKRVDLMVSPGGEFHAIGGDREPGEGDQPWLGMERLKARFERAEREKEKFHKTCGELLQATIEGDGSVTWSKMKCEKCASVEKDATNTINALRKCFKHDRADYHSNQELVREVEEALKKWDARKE